MGQTPSTTSRHDNASTRTLHSASIGANRPRSFFRRLSRHLSTHSSRRFGQQRSTSLRQGPSMTSSAHETLAAMHGAATATDPSPPGPPPPPVLHVNPPPSSSSSASTTSTTSNSSEISQVISDLIASAVLSSFSSSTQQDEINSSNNSATSIQFHDSTSFFRYMHMPIRSSSPQQQDASTSLRATVQQQQQTMMPIVIVGYRTSSNDSSSSTASHTSSANQLSQPRPTSSLAAQIPPRPYLRRPHSAISTSSSLATLQSMPLSNLTNQTLQIQQQLQNRDSLLSSPSSTSASSIRSTSSSTAAVSGNRGRWIVYVMSGPHRQQQQQRPPFTGLFSDNPTYEDLLWLSNVLGPARPINTTTQQAINATLPIYSWCDETTKQTVLQDTEQRCLVCLDDFVPKQSVRVLKCRHVFHVECVDRWLLEAQNSCPVCRGVVVTPSSD